MRSAGQSSNRAPTPIRRKLLRVVLLTTGAALLLTVLAFVGSEWIAVRSATQSRLGVLGEVIATNSTAALAFDDRLGATQTLEALRADPDVRAAALYDSRGQLFAIYPESAQGDARPNVPPRAPDAAAAVPADALQFSNGHLSGFLPVAENGRRMGTLYVQYDMRTLQDRMVLYAFIALAVMAAAGFLAYAVAHGLQRQITQPILALTEVARSVSERRDYSVRVPAPEGLELGQLTAAFNHMLGEVQGQLRRLHLLQQITRGIGERHDLPSILQLVLRTLEDHMTIDFTVVCLLDAQSEALTVETVGSRSRELAASLGLTEGTRVPIDGNGLSRCVRGELVYEADVRELDFPFPSRLVSGGLRSLVIAPLAVESRVFGVLICANRTENAFESVDCEFLQQLSAHVALASHQAQLHGTLQRAYEDLRQTQHTILQQERLRALGQMASGIAHDINNAISPVSLYTQFLLEKEPSLSARARECLVTIQQAIDDVAATVGRMREFYRPREAQLALAKVDLNRLVNQVLELTRARWRDVPQASGAMIELHADLDSDLPQFMGADAEIRDALTNLIFNAVDAMPAGGKLTLRTAVREAERGGPGRRVIVEVGDTGVGMVEETRRRCLEPFFTTKGERGTGLGLAMVYGMVQRHSAEIDVRSQLGRGTTVELGFQAPESAIDPTVGVRALRVPAQRMRILLVDDDPLLTECLRVMLEEDGHQVEAADGGQRGIETFRAAKAAGKPFGVVVTDLGMPYVDGRKVAAAVKDASPDTPVILLTGWGQRMQEEEEKPEHVTLVLSKPPKMHELRAALADVSAPARKKEHA
jgi:signal transduction histidine kinase/ActR/RegA family two-component response regulator/HAMP domain-containing protein